MPAPFHSFPMVEAAFHPLSDSLPPSFRSMPKRKPKEGNGELFPAKHSQLARIGFQTGSKEHRGILAPGWDPHQRDAGNTSTSAIRSTSPRRQAASAASHATNRSQRLPQIRMPPRTKSRLRPSSFVGALSSSHLQVTSAHPTRLVAWHPPERHLQPSCRHQESCQQRAGCESSGSNPAKVVGAAMDSAIGAIEAVHASRHWAENGTLRHSQSLPGRCPALSHARPLRAPVPQGGSSVRQPSHPQSDQQLRSAPEVIHLKEATPTKDGSVAFIGMENSAMMIGLHQLTPASPPFGSIASIQRDSQLQPRMERLDSPADGSAPPPSPSGVDSSPSRPVFEHHTGASAVNAAVLERTPALSNTQSTRMLTEGHGCMSPTDGSDRFGATLLCHSCAVMSECAARENGQFGAHYHAATPIGKTSLWAAKRGRHAVSIQERMIVEARRRRAEASKSVLTLSDVIKALSRNRRVISALSACDAFRCLNRVQLSMLAYGGHPMRLKRYGVLYREGAAATTSFYVLLRGSIQVAQDGSERQTIHLSNSCPKALVFGTESLSGDMKRYATVSALSACDLVAFSTRGMPLDASRLDQLAQRTFVTTIAATLRSTPVFMDLTERHLEVVAGLTELATYSPGESLFVEGEPCDKLFILLVGSVSITKARRHVATMENTTGELGLRSIFGGAGLMEPNARRPYGVTARTPADVLVLPIGTFRRFLKAGMRTFHAVYHAC